jgi:hypothetical protein
MSRIARRTRARMATRTVTRAAREEEVVLLLDV